MADQFYVGSGPVNLPAGSQLCTLAVQVPTKPRIRGMYLNVSFQGTSAVAAPVDCHVARITNTPSGSAIPANYGPNCTSDSAQATGVTAAAPSTASPGVWATPPTEGAIVWDMFLPPTTGMAQWWPLGQEIGVNGSGWLGVFLNAAAAVVAKTSINWWE